MWATSREINKAIPVGTHYQFYLILFDHYSSAMCIRKKEEFASYKGYKDVVRVPEIECLWL